MRARERTVAVYRSSLLARSETFIRNEALELRRSAPLFVGEERAEGGLPLPEDAVVVGMPNGRWRRAVLRRVPGYQLRRLARACRAREVALVHAHFGPDSLLALDLARRLGVPFVVTYNGFDATLHDDALRAGPYTRYLRRRAEMFGEAAAIIAISVFIAGELVRQGAPEGKLRVHHSGVPLGPPPPDGPREPVVLFVGRFVEKKGLGDLLEAMARVQAAVPAARLLVVGDGAGRREHEDRARRLGLDATFAGWLAPDEVARRQRTARVLCVPSRRAANGDAEGLPTVIPEAGAQGLPVVGTRHSGIPEGVGEEARARLVDEGDVEGLARELVAVLTDDELQRRLSAEARAHVARDFDPRRQADELEAIYDEVLGRATSR
jgi:colanic acid/amylovoran biosynthesis glycosyltransferase